jgi:indolepyruvate ferredoxin oxidoreductase
VDANLAALKIGRLAAVAPERLEVLCAQLAGGSRPAAPADLDALVARRRAQLAAYWNVAYADRYADLTARVKAAEAKHRPGSTVLARTVAEQAFRLMAYKDEYEVARLLTAPSFRAQLERTFAGRFALRYHLAPPILTRTDPLTGRPRKVAFGAWLTPLLRLLAAARRLRETLWDPFRFSADRKLERRLRDTYIDNIERLVAGLNAANHALAVEIAAVPAAIRGFGPVKAEAADAAMARFDELCARFAAAPQPWPPVSSTAGSDGHRLKLAS